VRKQTDWKRWLAALMLSVSLLALTSCVHCPPTVEIPLEWPDFPPPPDTVAMDDGVVSMPLEYWLEVAAYAVAVDRVRTIVGDTLER